MSTTLRAYSVAVALSLLVSVASIFWVFTGGEAGSATPFAVSPGLLAFAAASAVIAKPPTYQTVVLLVAMNAVWYLLLGLAFRFIMWAAGKIMAAFHAPSGMP